MKILFITFLSLIFPVFLSAQTLTLDSIVTLPTEVVESSGLIFFDGRLITHTDSGGKNALFEIDTNTAEVLRTVYISNSTNQDWEDITQDDNFIYIADIGNNSGSRTNLNILKIKKADYLLEDSVEAEFIYYSYEEQTDFTVTDKETNFDAEAIIAFEDSLYVFTKNWGNSQTSIYRIPKDSGTYVASKNGAFNVEGLITGADYNENTNTVFLIGYTTIGFPFAFSLTDFSQDIFFSGNISRLNVELKQSVQIEAICSTPYNKYYVSSEDFYTLKASLHSFGEEGVMTDNFSLLENNARSIAHPNPTRNKVCVNQEFDEAIMYNALGEKLLTVYESCFEVSTQKEGVYFLKFSDKTSQSKTIRIVKY